MNKCPELYDVVVPKKYSPLVKICKVNEEPISDHYLHTCLSNCTSCILYRQKHGTRPPKNTVQQNNNSSSGGIWGFIILIIIGYFVAKIMGLF